ncbi:MAG: CoA transferase [Parasphingorhabdus sp.]|nr:CoA transferase [Parasphingorhabdus sp.]
MKALLAERAGLLGLDAAWLLQRDAAGGLDKPGIYSANRHCRLLETNDGWVALNLAREDDRALVSAYYGMDDATVWEILEEKTLTLTAEAFLEQAAELQLPGARLGESKPLALRNSVATKISGRVLDISALWAGPLCAGLLARAGAEVVRIESIGRPDPTPHSSPLLNARINGGKTRLALDLRTDAGKAALLEEMEQADILVTSARADALGRLGLEPEKLQDKIWVAITAHGWNSDRVGFGDDCAVAGGLTGWQDGKPRFRGDALADPLTGLEAALAVLAGATGLIDMAMARVAAAYAAAQ